MFGWIGNRIAAMEEAMENTQMTDLDQIAAEAADQISGRIQGYDWRFDAIIKAACEKALQQGYDEGYAAGKTFVQTIAVAEGEEQPSQRDPKGGAIGADWA